MQEYSKERIPLLSLVKNSYKPKFYGELIVFIFIILIPLFLITPWQQTVTGTGRIIAFAPMDRQQYIDAPVEGRISKWYVMEGASVKKGDLILEISDNDPQFLSRLMEEKSAVEARIEALTARSESIKSRITFLDSSRNSGSLAANSRSQMAKERVESAVHAVDAAEAVYKTAQQNYNRQKNLFASGLTSERSLEMSQLDETRALTELNRAKAVLSATKSEMQALVSDSSKVTTDGRALVDDARAQYSAVLAELANAKAELPRISARLSRQHSQMVKAPRDGTIMRLIVSQDADMVKTGEPLAILIPETEDRAAEIWVDGNDIPLISEGREVILQFQGWPVVQFSGFPGLTFGAYSGKVEFVDSTDNGTGKFRILVKPSSEKVWPSSKFLRQGVRVNGWIFLNRVTIAYELWRRFNDFPPMIPIQKHGDSKG